MEGEWKNDQPYMINLTTHSFRGIVNLKYEIISIEINLYN
jgi:hypothetical protein